ncbi:hypothetical protein LBMAG42_55360 [Deltaproteobacteria bacterium]|nr:hypothetical protein LBMAG42_55360 [Deltaproteobacteria bacterium]
MNPDGDLMDRTLSLTLLAMFGAFAVAAAAGAAFAVMRPPAPEPAPRNVAILLDRSDSMEDGRGSSCPALELLTRRAFGIDGVRTGSNVRVFLSGDAVGQRMPVFGPAIQVPRREGGEMEGMDRMLQGAAIRAVREHCETNVSGLQLKRSPLYSSISGAVDTMHTDWRCSEAEPCTLLVRSDLQETEHKSVIAALRARDKKLSALVDALPALDLTGIDVKVCGTGESTEKIDEARATATDAVWRRVLPGVEVSPVCL